MDVLTQEDVQVDICLSDVNSKSELAETICLPKRTSRTRKTQSMARI